MQSTEEYLDQLLASVSDEESKSDTEIKQKKNHRKSIEELDESELTEETLQQQLALLLGLEVDSEESDDDDSEDDFMSQYAAQMKENENGISDFDISEEEAIVPEPVTAPEAPVAMAEPVTPVPAASDTGVLSPDEIAALFASMEAESEPEVKEEAKVEEPVAESVTPVPAASDTGVLSPDEIAALFASMEAESEPEVKEETKAEETVAEPAMPTPAPSDTGVLSPDEIAALFASMGTEDSSDKEETDVTDEVVLGRTESVSYEDRLLDNSGGLTREELEELGLGDIVDVLVDGEQEILAENVVAEMSEESMVQSEDAAVPEETVVQSAVPQEKEIIEIPDFDFGEEMLLELENVDAMLEATAKLAEEESGRADADAHAEEDIMSMLTQFEEESIQESIVAQEESAKAAEIAVNMALEPEEGIPAELLEGEADGKKKRKKAKKEKVKKEKTVKEKPVKEKPVKEKKDRVSLKDKILAFMFEEDSLEDEKVPIGEGDELAYMDLPQEETPAPKKKEKASKKDKKAKKAQAGGKAKDENAEIAAELEAEDKKKAKKKDKPKKEKKAKKVVISEKTADETEKRDSKRSIGAKGIVATLLVCASFLGLILVGTYFLPKQLSLMSARVAFYAQNYEETAMRMKGKDLNDSDRIMYEKASLLYGLEERYHQAEIYLKRGMDKEALNALLQGVVASNEEEILANQLGIEMEWKLAKDQFVNALQEQYGLDAETVEAICALRNPDYTVAVENILAGRRYDDKTAYGGSASNVGQNVPEEDLAGEDVTTQPVPGGLNPDEMEDLLPEEEEIIEQLQQENAQQTVEEPEPSETGENELYSGTIEGSEVNFVE